MSATLPRLAATLALALSLTGCAEDPSLDDLAATCPSGDAGEIFGLSIGSYQHRSNPGFHLNMDAMKELGARWVRLEAARPAALAEGQDPAAYYGESIRQLHARGLKVLLIVDYATSAAPTGGLVDNNVYVDRRTAEYRDSPGWAAYVPQFETDLRALVDGLPVLPDAWEVWNEPDQYEPIAGGTSGSGIPPQYFELVVDSAIRVIRARDAGATIVSGGSSSGNPGYLADVAASPKVAGNIFTRLDGIGMHVYRGPWADDISSYLRGSTRQRHQAAAGVAKPIWLTEAGSTHADVDPAGQATFLGGTYDVVAQDRAAGIAWGPVFYFSYNDTVGLEGEHFGLSDAAGNRRPGWSEYQRRSGGAIECSVPDVEDGTPEPQPEPQPQPQPAATCTTPMGTATATGEPWLNLRAGPSASAAILATIPFNTTVTLHGAPSGGWTKISAAGSCGYAASSYLE